MLGKRRGGSEERGVLGGGERGAFYFSRMDLMLEVFLFYFSILRVSFFFFFCSFFFLYFFSHYNSPALEVTLEKILESFPSRDENITLFVQILSLIFGDAFGVTLSSFSPSKEFFFSFSLIHFLFPGCLFFESNSRSIFFFIF